MNHAKKIAVLAIFLCCSACTNKEEKPLGEAGRRGDEIVDNVKKGKPPLHKNGPLEKAGEAVDESLGLDEKK